MGDVRIVGGGQNQGPIIAATVKDFLRGKPVAVVLMNASGDVYNALGAAAGGDGAILDGSDTSIKATVRNASGSVKPLHVIITNASGDMPNLAAPGGADGAIVDGVTSTTKATVLLGPTARPDSSSNPLVIQFADDPTRQIGRPSPPVTGVQIIGGSIGARVQPSGDFPVQVGSVTVPIGVSGDVTVTPKTGSTWPVSIDVANIDHIASGLIGVTGDVSVRQQAPIGVQVIGGAVGGRFSISGDQLNTSQQGVIGVQVVGGSVGSTVGISGDTVVNVVQRGAWAVGITGDVSIAVTIADIITVGNVLGVQLIGGSVGGTIAISGDGPISVNQRGAWATSVTGDVLLRANPGVAIGNVRITEVLGVQIVGGGTARVSISGDTLLVNQQGTWATSITGDVLLRANPSVIIGQLGGTLGVNIIGGMVGARISASGDLNVREQAVTGIQIVGGAVGGAVGISGDVLLRANPSIIIGQIGNTVGVNIIGGSVGSQVSPSGDFMVRVGDIDVQIGVSGDVSTKPLAGQTWQTREQGVIGVQVVGGQSGGSAGVSGDVTVKPTTTTNSGRFPVSGDTGIMDGVNRSIFATVRDYTNSNPVAVALTNSSGDVYNPVPEEPICGTIPFRVTSAGTTTVAGPYNGRVIKVCSYDLQAESDTAQCKFGSGASGSQLTPQWLFNAREGVAKQVSPLGGGYIFKTLLNQALVVENAGANFRGSVTFHTGDSI